MYTVHTNQRARFHRGNSRGMEYYAAISASAAVRAAATLAANGVECFVASTEAFPPRILLDTLPHSSACLFADGCGDSCVGCQNREAA